MIFFFHGTDAKKVGDKANSVVDKKMALKRDATLFKVTEENYSDDLMKELVQSRGLFENKYIVQIKRVLEDSEIADSILKLLKEMRDSENIFVWNEGKLTKTILNKIDKNAEKVYEVVGNEGKKEEKTRIFEICNPIIKRDKKGVWIKYQELIDLYSPEELHGTVFWQFKNIAIASKVKSQSESGLSGFPYNNAKSALDKYSKEDVLKNVSKLSEIVHETRLKGIDLGISLERFLLSI